MSRRGTIARRCTVCARSAERVGSSTRWTCPADPDHRVTWSAVVDVAPPGAKRRRLRRNFDTKDEAVAWVAELRTDIARGTRVEPNRTTLEVYLRSWLEGLELSGLEEGTISWYRSAALRHIISALGAYRLSDLDATVIETFLADKARSGRLDGTGGLGPASVRRLQVTLHKALDAAVRKRLLAHNPVDLVETPKVPKADVTEEVWSPETMTAFLDATREDRLGPVWQTVAMTGLRREEVAGLQWGDIDTEAMVLSVRRARTQVDGRVIVKGPKTSASRRTVDFDSQTAAVLRRWRQAQRAERLKAGPAWEPGEWAFADPLGAPWRPDALTRAFVRAVRALGFPRTDIKGLRHAHATAMLKSGAHPKVVQERLGHSSISVTMDIYSSVLPGMQREAVERLAEMMGGRPGG